jgi:protein-tyrosine-phosphatase
VASETLEVLAEMGVSTAGLHSKNLERFDLSEYCLLVNLTEHSLAGRLPAAYIDRIVHQPVPDPYGGSLPGYRRSRDAIDQRIIQKLCQGPDP